MRCDGPRGGGARRRRWRQWKHLTKTVKRLFNEGPVDPASPERVEAYLDRCREIVLASRGTCPRSRTARAPGRSRKSTASWRTPCARSTRPTAACSRARRSPSTRRLDLRAATRWISKGKAGCPVELGVPVCILEDRHGSCSITGHVGTATSTTRSERGRAGEVPRSPAVSFDRGFHSPGNRVRLDELLDDNVLPKKGYLNKATWSARGTKVSPRCGGSILRSSRRSTTSDTALDRVLAQGAVRPHRRPLRGRAERPQACCCAVQNA